jgi:hypothetical protein
MGKRPSRSLKWWWLSFDLRTLTAEERNARMALYMTTAVIAVLLLWLLAAIFAGIGVEEHVAATLAAPFSIVGGFCSARTIVRFLFPKLLQMADQNAGTRLPIEGPE